MSLRLPGGYIDEAGVVHQTVELSPLTGHEEELLACRNEVTRASMVTMMLSRCLHRIGTICPVPEPVVRGLLVGDRQYLLLKLWEITFGDQVQTTIFCPWSDCRNKMDLDFSIKDIPMKNAGSRRPTYKMQLSSAAAFVDDQGKTYQEVTFRLPTGADQETLSLLVAENEGEAAALLLKRCIQSIGPLNNPSDEELNRLSPQARMEIEQHMETVAPQMELMMEGECPECERKFTVPFDLQGFFFNGLKTNRDLLYREVHYLAYHYHWSEREIMDMPRDKRRRYIELLADEIERLNNAFV